MSHSTNAFGAFSNTKNFRAGGLTALLFAIFICLAVVQSTSAAAFVVTTAADSGAGSLRAAITAANTNAQADTITFNIPTGSVGCTGLVCTVTLTNSEFVILNDGAGNTLTIDGSGANRVTISGNNASRIFFVDTNASLSLINLTVTGGNGTGTTTSPANGFAGGIYNQDGTLTLNGVTVSGNTAATSSGGIATRGTTTLINSTVSGNTASFSGGIQIDIGTLNLINSTITNNSASGGATRTTAAGGVRIFDGTVNVKNTIIAGNTNVNNPDVRGAFNSQGYNLIGNTTGSTGFSATLNDILNPVGGAMLGALANNGGQTNTHALLAGSPAIDKGFSFGLTTDQRGFARPVDIPGIANAAGGDGADIGAFELQASDTLSRKTRFDFDGDGKADLSVFRPSEGNWFIDQSRDGFRAAQFGVATDKLAPADYDNDGRTDLAIYRNGVWVILNSRNNTVRYSNFGVAEDLPRPGDFDGDGFADISVWRPSSGTWFRINSSNGQFAAVQFGQSGDFPLLGDFDGDNKTDYAVFRPSEGNWFILRSSDSQYTVAQFGLSTDIPLNGDFTGDSKADLAIYRPSTGYWYYASADTINPAQNFKSVQFGKSSDTPVPADYDADGRTDIAVYRGGTWIILQSSINQVKYQQFGISSDKPVPAAYQP